MPLETTREDCAAWLAGHACDCTYEEVAQDALTAHDLQEEVERLQEELLDFTSDDTCLNCDRLEAECNEQQAQLARTEWPKAVAEIRHLRKIKNEITTELFETVATLRNCMDALDRLMGDTDALDDDSVEFRAMQRAAQFLHRVEENQRG